MRKHYLLWSIVLIVFLVASCGGGGGGGGGGSTPAPATGSATLTWTAPTTYEDNTTPLTVAGYRIYYGTASGNYNQSINIASTVTTYQVTGLTKGYTYYFCVKTLDNAAVESDCSNEQSKAL